MRGLIKTKRQTVESATDIGNHIVSTLAADVGFEHILWLPFFMYLGYRHLVISNIDNVRLATFKVKCKSNGSVE